MIPVNQFILGSSDPLLYPSEKMTNSIDEQIAPLTQEQQNMLLSNQDYVNNYNALQSMVQAEVLNLVKGKIEASADGKHLLEEQLKLVKLLKSKIVEVTNKEMELFKAFKEASKTNPNLTYEEWFGGNIDNKVFESAITFWFKDVDFDGDKAWEYFHMNN